MHHQPIDPAPLLARLVPRIQETHPNLSELGATELATYIIEGLEPQARAVLDGRTRAQNSAGFLKAYNAAQQLATDAIPRKLFAKMRDQLLLALIVRAGGEVGISVAEIDATGGLFLSMVATVTGFTFTVHNKS